MTDSPEPGSIRKADLQQEWQSAFQEIEKHGICALNLKLDTNGQDPLSHEVKLISLAFPGNAVHIAGFPEREMILQTTS
jgi:hypothetical protein